MKYRNLIIQDLITGNIEVIKDYAEMPLSFRYAYLEWRLQDYEKDKIPVKLDYSYGYNDN